MHLDEIDKQILQLLREDGRKSVSVISEIVGISRITARRRIDALEKAGIIAGYTIRHGPALERERFRAQILLKLKGNVGDELVGFWGTIPQVVNVTTISGHFDASLMIEAATSEQVDHILDQIRRHPAVERTESLLMLATKLDRSAL